MRMAVGDWLVYYSPRTDFPRGAPLRAFTALGRVVGERAYEVEMGRGFVPYRRDIAYVKGAREVPLRELASTLEFVTGRPSWGLLARRGHFEIGVRDLRRIAVAMALLPPGKRRRSRRRRPRVQDTDCPAHVERFPEPGGARRPRVEMKALRCVARPQGGDGIGERSGGRRHRGQRPTVRSPESEGPVRPARDLVALLVDRTVMAATEQDEVRERGRAALSPMAHVMPLPDADMAPREAAAPVSMLHGAS